MPRYVYLAPWVWATDPIEGPHWEPPNIGQVLGVLDRRSPSQSGAPGPAAQGLGIFVYATPQTITSSAQITADLDTSLSSSLRRGISRALGLEDDALAEVSLFKDVLWELATTWSDPTGLTRWKPLMPEADGVLRLYLGGFSLVKVEAFDPARHPFVVQVLQEEYRRVKAVSDGVLHRRVLGGWERPYWRSGLTARDFIPQDLPYEEPLEPRTVYTESFNKADNGLGPDLSWTLLNGSWVVLSNQARSSTTGENRARADAALDSADHYARAVHKGGSGSWAWGTMVRKDGTAANTFYLHRVSSSNSRCRKTVSGTSTWFDGGVGNSLSVNDVVETWINGSTLTSKVNGSQKQQFTDTDISGGLYGGIVSLLGTSTTVDLDDAEFGDAFSQKTVADSLGVMEAFPSGTPLARLTTTDILALAETVSVTLAISVADALALAEALSLKGSVSLTEGLAMSDALAATARLTVADALALAETASPKQFKGVADSLALADQVAKAALALRLLALASLAKEGLVMTGTAGPALNLSALTGRGLQLESTVKGG